jgi:hypothetical protein
MIKFMGFDTPASHGKNEARRILFDVDGKTIVKHIPDQFEGSTDDFIKATVDGILLAEATKAEAPKDLSDISFTVGDVIETAPVQLRKA